MAATVATLASAAGFDGGGTAAVLGQPLAFVTLVRLDPGESLEPDCVAAEVMAGERVLPASQVRTSIESQADGGARIRVATSSAMDEPVISVALSVGCQVRQTRNYIVLADPPETAPVVASPVAAAPAFAAAPADADALWPAPPVPTPAQAAEAAPLEVAAARLAAPVPPPAPARAAVPPAVPRAVVRPQRPARLRVQTRAPAPRTRAPAAAAPRRGVVADAPASLRLDFVEPVPGADAAAVELALEAVAQATSAARAQAAAASAAAARMVALERNVERLGAEAQASRDEAAQLRAQLGDAGSGRWLLPLTLLVALLAGLTAWLAWRLSTLQRDRQQVWHDAVMSPPATPVASDNLPSRQATSPIPFVTSEIQLPASSVAAARRHAALARPSIVAGQADAAADPAAVEVAADGPAVLRTEVLAAGPRVDDGAPRDVSIEELIDLEQQAEFFVVLGQDEAAVDLLMQHLRDTAGGSPLPYLKLLEIHHRSSDRAAYERIRVRFNQRFNAYAPEWGVDLQAGRSLEDYAGIVSRLQQVWARPLDAMAELEAMLFRKSRGELFELPAYREVLFLYALARDLLDREAVDPQHVDLLLPLADGGEFSSTAPSPFMDLPPAGGAGHAASDERATAPVDLDLSQAPPPASIFDALEPESRKPRP
ncbi:MAG: hypothetical protein U5L05_08340 [Rubrivivax sp.]|nr:hypothetical protein [Rubrivivax sp.]